MNCMESCWLGVTLEDPKKLSYITFQETSTLWVLLGYLEGKLNPEP